MDLSRINELKMVLVFQIDDQVLRDIPQKHLELRTAKDDSVEPSATISHVTAVGAQDDVQEALLRLRIHYAVTEFLEDDAVDFVDLQFLESINYFQSVLLKMPLHEILSHGELRTKKRHTPAPFSFALVGNAITDVDEPRVDAIQTGSMAMLIPLNLLNDFLRDLMHGVRRQRNIVAVRVISKLPGFCRQQLSYAIPSAFLHQLMILLEVHTPEHQIGGNESTGALVNLTIEALVVLGGRLVAHSTDDTNLFHYHSSLKKVQILCLPWFWVGAKDSSIIISYFLNYGNVRL